jgi:CheY-like chemotaxis protein
VTPQDVAVGPVGRVLLVDDNEADNVFHKIVIEEAGYVGELLVFDEALEAIAALAELEDGCPTMIFLDLNMPGTDGWEFAALAAPLLRTRPWVSISILTSSASEQDQQRARAQEMLLAFLTKPLTVAQAKAALRLA